MHAAWILAAAITITQQTQPTAPTPPKPDLSTMSGSATASYNSLKGLILRSADKMPAEHFAFQPTPEVRSYGQLLAHIADANYLLCAPALPEANPNGATMDKIEKDKLSREALIAKLKETFTYCDRAYAGFTDANAAEVITFFNSKRPRVSVLWTHISHANEHYGNLVTYMRLKGIVPPSSER